MSASSSYDLVPQTVVDTSGGGRAVIPSAQAQVSDHNSAFYTYTITPVPSNLFANNGSMFRAVIPRSPGVLPKIKSVQLQITLTLASTVTLVPAPYWFSRIEFRTQSAGTPFWVLYNDSLMANNMLNVNEFNRGFFRQLAMSDDPRWIYTAGEQLTSGTYNFAIDLVGGPWDTAPLAIGAADTDLMIDFYPDTQITSSGTSTNVSCANINVVFETEDLMDHDMSTQMRRYRNIAHINNYLEATTVYQASQTLTAGSLYNLDLSSITGKVAFLMLLVRANGPGNASNNNYLYINLGDDCASQPATLDFTDAGGRSLLGLGTPLQTRYLRNEVFSRYFNGSNWALRKSAYILPFSDVLRGMNGAYGGAMKGFWQFDPSQKTYLAIRPAGALTQEVQTVTLSGQPASGFYRVAYKQSKSDPLAYNASASSIQTAFNGLRDAIADDITVTVNQALSAGTSSTFTFSSQFQPVQRDNQNLVQIIDNSMQTSAPAAISATTTRSTVGNGGFSTGTYYITCVAFRFRTLVSANGITRAVDA